MKLGECRPGYHLRVYKLVDFAAFIKDVSFQNQLSKLNQALFKATKTTFLGGK
jgi:hypothetical protein